MQNTWLAAGGWGGWEPVLCLHLARSNGQPNVILARAVLDPRPITRSRGLLLWSSCPVPAWAPVVGAVPATCLSCATWQRVGGANVKITLTASLDCGETLSTAQLSQITHIDRSSQSWWDGWSWSLSTGPQTGSASRSTASRTRSGNHRLHKQDSARPTVIALSTDVSRTGWVSNLL